MPLLKTLKNPRSLLIASAIFCITLSAGVYLSYSPDSKYNQDIPTARSAVSTSTWVGGTTGNWQDSANWSDAAVPDATKDVLISSSTAITITATGTLNFESLVVGSGSATSTLILTGDIGTGTNITIGDNGTLTQNNTSTQTISGDLIIQSGGLLNHGDNSTTQANIINISATGNINIQSGGSVNVNGLGYDTAGTGERAYSPTDDGGGTSNSWNGGGGANGGNGGQGNSATGYGGVAYCNISNPSMGAGGARTAWSAGGSGGGLIMLQATSKITINGTITANGSDSGNSGSGGGGGVKLVASTIDGAPENFFLTGGSSSSDHGGGGGGCAYIEYATSNSISGTDISMRGGIGSSYKKGGAGQVLIKDTSANGDLFVINGGVSATSSPILAGTPSTLDTLYV